MGLYRRAGSHIWQMHFRDEQGRTCRKSTRTADRTAAEIMLARETEAVERRRLGIPAPSPLRAGRPFAELTSTYLAAIERSGLSPKYIRNERSRLERMTAAMRWTRITDMTTASLTRFVEHHLAEHAHKTVKAYVETARLFAAWAMEQRPPILASNPAAGVLPKLRGKAGRVAKQTVYQRRPLWTDEIPRLLTCPPPPTHAAAWHDQRLPIYAVALRTGYRRSTLAALRVEHVRVDVANPHIRVPPELTKSGRGIVTPIEDPAVLELIERRLALCMAFHLPRHLRGRPFCPVPNVATLRRDLRRAGIDPDSGGQVVDFHSFRYSFCVQLALAGVPLLVARDLMDHADIKTTMQVYARAGIIETAMGIRALPKLTDLGLKPRAATARIG